MSEIELENIQNGSFEEAFLFEGILERHLRDYEEHWKPLLDRKYKEIFKDSKPTLADVGAHQLQDSHWNWKTKNLKRSGNLSYRSFAIECDGMTQGLMYLNLTERCQLPTQKGEHLVYGEYLATAPWNRKPLVEQAVYRGIGTVMIATAINVSVDEEFKGRVGLHSLPQANQFYRGTCGMTEVGPDAKAPDLTYFEYTPDQAKQFLSQTM